MSYTITIVTDTYAGNFPDFKLQMKFVPYVGKCRTNMSHTGTLFYIYINISYRIKIGFVLVYALNMIVQKQLK